MEEKTGKRRLKEEENPQQTNEITCTNEGKQSYLATLRSSKRVNLQLKTIICN